MKILLNEQSIGIFLGTDYVITDEYVSINGAINTQYNALNTTEIDTDCPQPPLSDTWKWQDDVWVCINQEGVDAYNENIKEMHNAKQKELRLKAYEQESDPVFFKWQRGEATQQEWLDAVAKVPLQFPYQE